MKFFTLGRTINIRDKTNLAIALFTMILFIFGACYHHIAFGLKLSAGIFLCWAIAREIDIEYDMFAFFAALLALINIFILKDIDLFVLFYVLLTIRLITGITGKKHTRFDLIFIVALSCLLSFLRFNNGYLFLTFIAFMLTYIDEKESKDLLVGAFSSLALFFILFISFGPMELGILFSEKVTTIIITIFFVILICYHLISRTSKGSPLFDDQGKALSLTRVRHGQIFMLICLLWFLMLDSLAIATYVILFSSVIGVVLPYFIMIGKNGRNKKSEG